MNNSLSQPTWQHSNSVKWLVLLALLVGLIYLLKPMLPPFLVGAVFAYLGNPLVMRLQRHGVYRTWAVAVVFCLLSALAVMTLIITLPLLVQQIEMMISKVPDMIEWVQQVALPFIQKRTGINLSRIDLKSLKMATTTTGSWGSIGNVAGQVFLQVTNSSLKVLGVLGNLALIPVVTF